MVTALGLSPATQGVNIMASTQTPTATAKPSTKPAATVTAEVPAWYAKYNAVITAANGALGNPITADEAKAGCLIGGSEHKPKRAGVEALHLALVLRPEGVSANDFVTIKTRAGERAGKADNCLHYASTNLTRAAFHWVFVTTAANNTRVARLTAKGAAYLKASGVSAKAVDRMAKPYEAPKVAKQPATPKADKPASTKPASTKPATPKADKPAAATGKPADAAKPSTGTAPAPAQKPTGEAAKPVVVPATNEPKK